MFIEKIYISVLAPHVAFGRTEKVSSEAAFGIIPVTFNYSSVKVYLRLSFISNRRREFPKYDHVFYKLYVSRSRRYPIKGIRFETISVHNFAVYTCIQLLFAQDR